jgi:maleylpyruvate isomerase
MSDADVPSRLPAIEAASDRLLATVDALTDDDLRAPSVLPGWSRGHVVAHLVLNAEGLAGALTGLAESRPTPMYAGNEARDADIEALAAAGPDAIRARLRPALAGFADAVRRVPAAAWSGTVDRLPDGPAIDAVETLAMRHREVEIHHADLDSGYGWVDWPEPFTVDVLDSVTVDQAAAGPFTVTATDLGRSWPVGDGAGPEVTGAGAAIGWWLVGRGGGEGLACESGPLPDLAPWRRSPQPPDAGSDPASGGRG